MPNIQSQQVREADLIDALSRSHARQVEASSRATQRVGTITSEQRAYLISDFKAASMSELRAMATSWGVIGRSKMRKAELVETLVNLSIERAEVREAQKKAMGELHAEALEMNEKREVVRAALSIPAESSLPWTAIEQAYDAYVIGREETNPNVPQCSNEVLGLSITNAVTSVPAKLCDHGIDVTRRCSICVEDTSRFSWHVNKFHRNGVCTKYGPQCVCLSMINIAHVDAIRLDEDREIYRWVTDLEPNWVTDWSAVIEYGRKREHFTNAQWSKIAQRAADANLKESA